jgi:hypothetical protein
LYRAAASRKKSFAAMLLFLTTLGVAANLDAVMALLNWGWTDEGFVNMIGDAALAASLATVGFLAWAAYLMITGLLRWQHAARADRAQARAARAQAHAEAVAEGAVADSADHAGHVEDEEPAHAAAGDVSEAVARMLQIIQDYHVIIGVPKGGLPGDIRLEDAVLANKRNTGTKGNVRKTDTLVWLNNQTLQLQTASPSTTMVDPAAFGISDHREQFTEWVKTAKSEFTSSCPTLRASVYVLAFLDRPLEELKPPELSHFKVARAEAVAKPVTPDAGDGIEDHSSRGADEWYRGDVGIRAMSLLAQDGNQQFARELDALLQRWQFATVL